MMIGFSFDTLKVKTKNPENQIPFMKIPVQ